jgi:hypothetical protein
MREAKCLIYEPEQPDCSKAAEGGGKREKTWAGAAIGWSAGMLTDRRVILVLRMVLAAIFLASAAGKLIDIDRYSIRAVYEFNILPGSVARVYGLALPFIELICALGLLFGVLTRFSALGIGALSVSFFAAKGIILLRGQDIACGCFGPITSTLASVSIYADPPILLMSLAVMLSPDLSRKWFSIGKGLSAKAGGTPDGRGAQTLTLALSAPRRGISFRD